MRATRIALALLMLGWLGRSGAQKPEDLRAQLESASANTALDDPAVIPWHLKMQVQLFDRKGSPTESGTVEEWWSKPEAYRITYSFPSYTGLLVHTAAGAFHSTGPGAPPVMADVLLHQVMHPLPDSDELFQVTPDNRKEKFGSVDYDCIMLDKPIKNVAYPPIGLFPTYCFEHSKGALAASFEYGQEMTLRTKLGTFQKKTVPLALYVDESQVKVAAAQVSLLEGHSSPYAESSDITGLEPSKPAADIPGGVIAGSLVNKVAPHYPESAKAKHISGVVILHAIIGRDGHIRRLTPVQVPDADLAIAALAAVRQWTYKPYLLNSQPTEVDTTITVNFTLSPF